MRSVGGAAELDVGEECLFWRGAASGSWMPGVPVQGVRRSSGAVSSGNRSRRQLQLRVMDRISLGWMLIGCYAVLAVWQGWAFCVTGRAVSGLILLASLAGAGSLLGGLVERLRRRG